MAKEPTELRPKAVRPIRPGNVEKHELYAEVGRAVVLLSDIESLLVAIAFHVALPTSSMKVPDMFYAIFGFERRLQFADVIVELEATDDEKKRWQEITSELWVSEALLSYTTAIGKSAPGTMSTSTSTPSQVTRLLCASIG